ncbi:MAG: hypothetical protein GKC10_04290 [Methanosarcinales archaeon]|nr:hypothetical protein [Methanosarcinales archaeon]
MGFTVEFILNVSRSKIRGANKICFALLALAIVALCTTPLAASGQENDTSSSQKPILMYVLSTRDDNSHWYKDPADLNPLIETLAESGYMAEIEDETTLPTISIQKMYNYDQIWILEGDWDDVVEVTPEEADDLYRYYENGGGVWISLEAAYTPDKLYGVWNEDALVFARRFGVDYDSYDTSDRAGKMVSSDHPLLEGINYLCFDESCGCIKSDDPRGAILWKYSPVCPGIIAMDDRASDRGRAVIDSGWVMGYAYFDRNDDLQFSLNVARWLSNNHPSLYWII